MRRRSIRLLAAYRCRFLLFADKGGYTVSWMCTITMKFNSRAFLNSETEQVDESISASAAAGGEAAGATLVNG